MAIVSMPPFFHPFGTYAASGDTTPVVFSAMTMNASGEQVALIFRAPKSGSIRKVGFRINAITTPTDTDVRVETVSARFPSGTLWATNTNGSISSGSLTAGVMNMATMTADAVVSLNDLVAVVFVPSGTPNMAISRLSLVAKNHLPYGALFDAGAWSGSNTPPPLVAIEYSDVSYALLPSVPPISGVNTHTYNSGSTPDEIGARFRSPVSMRVSGGWLGIDLDNDAEVVLYGADGVTPLATSTTLTNAGRSAASGASAFHFMFPSAVTLAANTYYYLSVKPGASNVSVYSWDMLSAAALDQLPGGQDWHYVSAKDPANVASWTPILTRYPIMGLLIDGIDRGAVTAKPNIFDSAIIRAVHQ